VPDKFVPALGGFVRERQRNRPKLVRFVLCEEQGLFKNIEQNLAVAFQNFIRFWLLWTWPPITGRAFWRRREEAGKKPLAEQEPILKKQRRDLRLHHEMHRHWSPIIVHAARPITGGEQIVGRPSPRTRATAVAGRGAARWIDVAMSRSRSPPPRLPPSRCLSLYSWFDE